MDRDRKSSRDAASNREDGTQPANPNALAERVKHQQRHKASRAKRAILDHIHKATEGAFLGANLFQAMVRGDAVEEVNRKLHPEMAEKITDTIIDKVGDKLKEAIAEVSEVGKEISEKSTAVFGAIKSSLSDKIKNQQDLTVLQVAGDVTGAIIEAHRQAAERLKEAVEHLPDEKLAAAADYIWQMREIGRQSPDAQADSPESGKLADGAQDLAMEAMGLPQAGGVAAEAVALEAYSLFQAGVRDHAMSAGERADAVQHRLANPGEDQEKLERAEKDSLKSGTRESIEKDKRLQKRTEMMQTGPAGGEAPTSTEKGVS